MKDGSCVFDMQAWAIQTGPKEILAISSTAAQRGPLQNASEAKLRG